MSTQAPKQTEAPASSRELVPSISDGHFEDMINGRRLAELQGLFDRIPLEGVRRRIIKAFEDSRQTNESDWYQVRIRRLVSSQNLIDVAVGGELLRVYLSWFKSHPQPKIEFALSLATYPDRFGLHKYVLGLIKRDAFLYWSVPGLRQYVLDTLTDLPMVPAGTIRRGAVEDVLDATWHRLERAVRCILLARDVTVIESLKAAEHAFGVLASSVYNSEGGSTDLLDIRQKKYVFLETAALLEEEKKKQWPDLFQTVGRWIKTMRPLKEFVRVHCDSPLLRVEGEYLRRSKPFGHNDFHELVYAFRFENERHLEEAAFMEDLAKLRIGFDGKEADLYACLEETCEATRKAKSNIDRGNSPHGAFNVWGVQGKVTFRLYLRKGMNRVTFTFSLHQDGAEPKRLSYTAYVEVI